MTNNTSLTNANPEDVQILERAQIRLIGLYTRWQKKGGWRKVANYRDLLNVSYVYNFAVNGIVPKNPDIRRKLYLPRVLPSERKPKAKREPKPKVWENPELYLRKVKP